MVVSRWGLGWFLGFIDWSPLFHSIGNFVMNLEGLQAPSMIVSEKPKNKPKSDLTEIRDFQWLAVHSKTFPTNHQVRNGKSIRTGGTLWKTNIGNGKSRFFNSRYVFKWLLCFIVMLVVRGLAGILKKSWQNPEASASNWESATIDSFWSNKGEAIK